MSNTPKPVKRNATAKKEFSLQDFKSKNNINNEVAIKKLEWYRCSPALQKATGIPGFPKGYTSLSRGFSNTGKSTSVSEAAVAAQKEGDLVIFFDTENNIGRERLEKMGLNWDEVLLIDNEFLLENFGKKQDKNRNDASIEDLGTAIHYFLDLQDTGKLENNILFIIDSIGTLNCNATIKAYEANSSDNNMWNANAYEKTFKYLLNSRIPNSRKVNKKFINTLIVVQKIWIDNMGNGVVKHKGGEAFFYGSRLIFHHGGIKGHGTRAVSAQKEGRKVQYGIETKVGVVKNQIDGDDIGGISLEEGKVISTPHGFIESGTEKEYVKENIEYFRTILGSQTIDVDDIEISHDALPENGEDLNNLDFMNNNE